MFSRFWSFISSIGIKPGYDDKLVKRITLINQYNIIATIIFLLSGINNYILGDTFSFLLIEGFTLLCIAGFVMNYLHMHTFAVSFLFTVISFAIFYFDSYSGILSGTYLYHFPIILAIAFVFDVKKDRLRMLFHFLLILTFIAINLVTHYSLFKSNFLTDDKRYQMFAFNLLFSAATVGFFIYLTVKNSQKESELYQQRLTEREAAEKAITQALAEKDILLTELHHRVKNNLAIISGLFNLKLNTATHEDARSVLIESRNRVRSMALIHNRLYNSNDFSQVDFGNYVKELVKEIQASYPEMSANIKVETNLSGIYLNMTVAVPCGLILNELLTNCYKHAFSDKKEGEIHVSITRQGDKVQMKVSDNGKGISPEVERHQSLGIVVIEALCDQLDGKHKFITHNGTSFELLFSAPDQA